MPHSKRLATLLATVVYLKAKATDDALELFDVVMTSELLARAELQSNADKFSRYARLDKDASRLVSAVSVSLAADDGWVQVEHCTTASATVATRGRRPSTPVTSVRAALFGFVPPAAAALPRRGPGQRFQ
jgi:hypothetical protein